MGQPNFLLLVIMIPAINWWREMVSSRIPDDRLHGYYSKILEERPLGTWPPCDYEPLKQILQPVYEHSKGKLLVVIRSCCMILFYWQWSESHLILIRRNIKQYNTSDSLGILKLFVWFLVSGKKLSSKWPNAYSIWRWIHSLVMAIIEDGQRYSSKKHVSFI